MFTKLHVPRALTALLMLLLLAACAAPPEAAPGAATGCPEPAEGNQLFTNNEDGYCLIHPESFVVEGNAGEDRWISPAPGRAANTPPVPQLPFAYIQVEDAAGQSAADAAAAFLAAFGMMEGTSSETTVGGEPAVVLDQVPGQEVERRVLVVHNDTLYTLVFAPADPAHEKFAELEPLYATIVNSFTFLDGSAEAPSGGEETPVVETPVAETPATETPAGEGPPQEPFMGAGWLLVQTPDNQVVRLGLDGSSTPVATVGEALRHAGFAYNRMSDGPIVYAYSTDGTPVLRAIDTISGQVIPQEFVGVQAPALAVYPLTETVADGTRTPLSLAWGAMSDSEPLTTSLLLGSPDGSVQQVAAEVGFEDGEPPFTFLPLQWSADGNTIYFSQQPYGIGGFIPFRASGNVYAYNIEDGSTDTLFTAPHEGIGFCVDELSADAQWLAHHCDEGGALTLLNLATDERSMIALPEGRESALFGTVRFSPDRSRAAYALAQGDPDALQSAVAVSSGMGGASQIILSQEESQLIHVVQWLDAETLLLQIYGETPSVWTVRADGTDLTKLTDGTLLGYNFSAQ